MRYAVRMSDPMARLDAAARRYDEIKTAFEEAQSEAIAASLDALRAGKMPTEVADRSPFTAAYLRILARKAGIPPAQPGKKPKQR